MSFSSFWKNSVKETYRIFDVVERNFSSILTSEALEKLTNGRHVRLLSRSSGKFLRIIRTDNAGLAVDLTAEEKDAVLWEVINFGRNVVALHNNSNYLCMREGSLVVTNFGGECRVPQSCMFMTRSSSGKFVSFENEGYKKSFMGVLPHGQLKNGVAGHKDDADCHFSVISE